ncbi:glycosyltransferase family 39 protein [Sulfurimonas sp. HSL1-2]|uniref:ArnT family glycosyltransferase n=1 Tax=Thiomicrolovo zhangzhouensis TaxID=3131933 RepID=UPI0031F860E7
MKLLRAHSPLWALIALFTLLRLAVIGHFGLGVDEAHYVLYGLYPALSYFDHPPLVGWTEWLFTALLGVNEFAARVPAVLIGAAATALLYFWLLRIFDSGRLALWGALALNASFLFNALFMMLMPDTLLFLFAIPVMITALKIEEHNRLGDWLLLGFLLGLSGLSKYTAVLFVAALLLYFAYRRRWDLFLTPKLLPAVLLAAAVVSPVLLWNIQNGWISFAYQSAHVAGSGGISLNAFAQSLGAQFGAYSPFLFPLAFYGLYRALKTPQNAPLFLSGVFGLTLMAFFTYNSFFARALPHWTALFYMLFVPIGTVMLLQKSRGWQRYAKSAVAVSGLLVLVLYAELRSPFIPLPDYKSLHRDLYGWDTIMRRAAGQITDPARQAAAVTNWSLASRALYYGRSYGIDTYLVDNRFDQFDLWQPETPEGRDLLFITTHDFKKGITPAMRCDSTEQAAIFDLNLNGRKVNTVTLTWCRGFKGAQ